MLDPDGVMVTLVHVGPDPEQPPEPRTLRSAPELSTDLARETVSFLSVPVSSRGKALGTLYLTARRDMLFSAEDDGVLTALAAAAGIAIVNARLYEAAEASRIWLAAVTDVLTALLQGRSLQDVLDLEVNRVAVLTGGRRDLPGARPDRP